MFPTIIKRGFESSFSVSVSTAHCRHLTFCLKIAFSAVLRSWKDIQLCHATFLLCCNRFTLEHLAKGSKSPGKSSNRPLLTVIGGVVALNVCSLCALVVQSEILIKFWEWIVCYRRPANYTSVKMKTGARWSSWEAVFKFWISMHSAFAPTIEISPNIEISQPLKLFQPSYPQLYVKKPCSRSCILNMGRS